jgi:acyl carrier protein
LRQQLRHAEPDAALDLLQTHLREQIGQVLRLASNAIEVHAPLSSLGLDSLMALELRNRLEPTLGLTLSATMLWAYPTVATLAAHLIDRLRPAVSPSIATRPESDAAALDTLSELSDHEAEALLVTRLGALDQRYAR